MSPPRLAVAQLPGTGAEVEERLGWLEQAAVAAVAERADLLLLPEAALTGYRLGPSPEGPARQARATSAALARDLGLHLVVGLLDPQGSWLELVRPDGSRHAYRKRFPTLRESRWQQAGDAAAAIADSDLGRIGLVLCADLMQSATWRRLHGRVDLLLVAAAWPDYRGRLDRTAAPLRPLLAPITQNSPAYMQDFLPRAAAAAGCPLALANLAGPWHPPESFCGGSAIVDGQGQVLARMQADDGLDGPVLRIASPGAGAPGPHPAAHPLPWRLMSAGHRWSARLRRSLR